MSTSSESPEEAASESSKQVREPSEQASKPSTASKSGQSGYDSAKLRFVGACACIAAGLAVAGSVDRSTGGVLVLIGWIAGVATLHRLGRAGSNT